LGLVSHCKVLPDEEEHDIFINGLDEPLKAQVLLLKPTTLEDAMDIACLLEHPAKVTAAARAAWSGRSSRPAAAPDASAVGSATEVPVLHAHSRNFHWWRWRTTVTRACATTVMIPLSMDIAARNFLCYRFPATLTMTSLLMMLGMTSNPNFVARLVQHLQHSDHAATRHHWRGLAHDSRRHRLHTKLCGT
jgi:hypothetical protein